MSRIQTKNSFAFLAPIKHEREFLLPNISQCVWMVFPFPNSGKEFLDFPFLSQIAWHISKLLPSQTLCTYIAKFKISTWPPGLTEKIWMALDLGGWFVWPFIPGTFSGLSQDSPRTFPGLFQDFLGTFSGLSRNIVRTFSGLSQDFLGAFSENLITFWGLSQNFYDCLRTLLGFSQDCLRTC